MKFYDSQHLAMINQFNCLWENLQELQKMAHEYGIDDIFQDNGGKILQQLVYLNMKLLPGREGNDAISSSGIEWEMKSINLSTSARGFSTNHHTNHAIIEKYRKVPWTFALYRGITLDEIYVMSPRMLEPLYQQWEKELERKSHLNNPKIPVRFVRENGILVYPFQSEHPFDPDLIVL